MSEHQPRSKVNSQEPGTTLWERIMTNSRTLAMIGAFCVGLAPLAVSPAFAQTPPEAIVVTGKYGQVPDSVQSVSQRMRYADIDPRNSKHPDILQHRGRLQERAWKSHV